MVAKKTIAWVTPDYFVDCDFNINVLTEILKDFKIYWLVLLPKNNARFKEEDFSTLKSLPGIEIEFHYWSKRARNPQMLFFYEGIYQRIKAIKPDLTYFNYVPTSPYVLPLYWRLSANKTIVAAHDGNVKPSFNKAWISKLVFKLAFGTKKFVNTFSPTEAALFKADFKKSKLFIIPLGLKDFGRSEVAKRSDAVVFLFFGSIHSNKNIQLLIEAGNKLDEEGIKGFKIVIKGACTDWEPYQKMIRNPEVFECDIRLHENSEIPKMFTESHYSVFPYKQMSQSGALKVALNYNSPVIVSNLEGFTNEIAHNQNGFVFKSESLTELVQLMKDKIALNATEYSQQFESISRYNQGRYGADVQAKQYVNMFNEVLTTSA